MLLKCIFLILLVLSTCQQAAAKPIGRLKIQILEAESEQHKKSSKDFMKTEHNNGIRAQRQVVQPKWLSGKDLPSVFVDPRVRVTDQNLREAAAIRAAIQQTIDADTFAVNPSQPSSAQNVPPSVFNFEQDAAPPSLFKFAEDPVPSKFPTFQKHVALFQRNLSAFQEWFRANFPNFPTFVGATQTQPEPPEQEATPAAEAAPEAIQKTFLPNFSNFPTLVGDTQAQTAPEPTPNAAVQNTQANADFNENAAQTKFMDAFENQWLEFVENSKKMWSSMPAPETLADDVFITEFKALWGEFVEASKHMLTWNFLELLD